MISSLAILLLGIVGAYAQCNDGGRVNCYVNLYMNNEISDKKSLCDQLPYTQQCVNNTGCPMDKLDSYLESLIKSCDCCPHLYCDTSCDLFQSIECSKKFKGPKKNMTFCQALEGIKKCYSTNNCDNVMNENPAFFQMCDDANDNVDESAIWKTGRLGKILQKVKKTLIAKKGDQPKPEVPTTTAPATTAPVTTALPAGN